MSPLDVADEGSLYKLLDRLLRLPGGDRIAFAHVVMADDSCTDAERPEAIKTLLEIIHQRPVQVFHLVP